MKKAIVTDVRYRMTLPAIRCLARHGITVVACEYADTPKDKALGFYSRYASEKLTVNCLVPDLIAYAKNQDEKCVLIPFGAKTLLTVCNNRQELEKYFDLCVPDIEALEFAGDKQRVTSLALELGIKVPHNYNITCLEDIEKTQIDYPCVIKYKNGEMLGLEPRERYKIVDSKEKLIQTYDKMSKIQSLPLVQQYIKGEGYGVSFVFDKNGNPASAICHKRLREYPVSGGPSCLCESVWDDKLYHDALKLLKKIGWQGVAMVEFKSDVLMEINPRFWGSSALSCLCGADSVYHLYKACCGELYSQPDTSYRVGKKMRFLLQDLLSFKGYLKKSQHKLCFVFSFIFCDLLNPFVLDGVFSFKDIKASLMYYKNAFGKKDKIIKDDVGKNEN